MEKSIQVRYEVLRIINRFDIDSMLNKGEDERRKRWMLQELEVSNVKKMLDLVDDEYGKVKEDIGELYSCYDGYLIPLDQGRYLRILKVLNETVGFVYYVRDYSIRVIGGIDKERFRCTMYKLGVIRGIDYA